MLFLCILGYTHGYVPPHKKYLISIINEATFRQFEFLVKVTNSNAVQVTTKYHVKELKTGATIGIGLKVSKSGNKIAKLEQSLIQQNKDWHRTAPQGGTRVQKSDIVLTKWDKEPQQLKLVTQDSDRVVQIKIVIVLETQETKENNDLEFTGYHCI